MILDTERYNRLCRRLERSADLDGLAREFDLDKDTVFVIYSQLTVRMATSNYYKVKNRSDRLYSDWKRGESLGDISKRESFPAVLTALLILQRHGWSKKRFRTTLNDLDSIKDERLRRELIQVCEADILYSPRGNMIQTQRGELGEKRMQNLLIQKGIEFQTEEELRSGNGKTPDFLIKGSFPYKGKDIHWVESKASFGDRREANRNLKNQLVHYLDEHGSGMVVYWFGITTDIPRHDGIIVETDEIERDFV